MHFNIDNIEYICRECSHLTEISNFSLKTQSSSTNYEKKIENKISQIIYESESEDEYNDSINTIDLYTDRINKKQINLIKYLN